MRLSASQYGAFWAQYETRGLLAGQTPPATLVGWVCAADVRISSIRPRAIESAAACCAETFTQEAGLIEAPLPPPPFPEWVKLSPKIWGFLSRFWWWFFNHHRGQETRRQAEARADIAAVMLIGHAEAGQDVAVLAHGFFNFMIGRALKRRGWRMTASEGFRYWSARRFERP